MLRRVGSAVIVSTALAIVLPSAAWAFSAHRETFSSSILATQRKPSNSDRDWGMPARSGSGTIVTDGAGPSSAYGLQLVRDIPGLPDSVVARASGINNSSPANYFVQLSWRPGSYHFDFRQTTRGSGTGYGEARW
jgi:hypothetical protein